MDARIRHDPVAVVRSVEGNIPGSAEDRAVSMFTKSKRGTETSGLQQEARVFDYKPGTPKDDQIRVIEYSYRGNASDTPRTMQNAADLIRGLTLADSDEDYEFCDYSYSSEGPKRETISRQANLPESPKYGVTSTELYPQSSDHASDDRDGVILSPHWVDHTFGISPTPRACSAMPNLSQTMEDPPEDAKPSVQRSDEFSNSHNPDSQIIIRESLLGERRLALLDVSEMSGNARTEGPSEKCTELEAQIGHPLGQMKDPADKSESFNLTKPRADQPPDKNSEFCMKQHEGEKAHLLCSRAALSDCRHGEVGEPCTEEITVTLHQHDLESKMSASIPLSNFTSDHLSVDWTSEAQEWVNSDFDLMTHSVFGTGSWVEEDGNDLSNLDVEGLCEVYSMSNDGGRFGDEWKLTLRNHGDSTASGSSPENKSGGNSAKSGSGKAHQLRSNGGSGHHKRNSEGGDGMGDEDDPDQSKKAKTDKGSERRLTCPFWVHDPQYFRTSPEHGIKYRTCADGKGFPDIARLKEHLRRVHSPEILCARCGAKFAQQGDLESHLRHEDGPECPNRDLPLPKSMTDTMRRKLSGRGKYDKSHSDEDKWLVIYHLLFPNEPRPSTGAYRHYFGQPSTPYQENQTLIHNSENDLPRLLEQRLDTQLVYMLSDPNFREQVKKMVIDELVMCIKQLSTDLPERPLSFDDSNVLRNTQSGVSSIDSGYGSRCGSNVCMGNCRVCEQLASPLVYPSQQYFQQVDLPHFDPQDQYLNPSVFPNDESAGHLQLTENMDEFVDTFSIFS